MSKRELRGLHRYGIAITRLYGFRIRTQASGKRPVATAPDRPVVLKGGLCLRITPGDVIRSGAHPGICILFFYRLPSSHNGCAQTTLGEPFP